MTLLSTTGFSNIAQHHCDYGLQI